MARLQAALSGLSLRDAARGQKAPLLARSSAVLQARILRIIDAVLALIEAILIIGLTEDKLVTIVMAITALGAIAIVVAMAADFLTPNVSDVALTQGDVTKTPVSLVAVFNLTL